MYGSDAQVLEMFRSPKVQVQYKTWQAIDPGILGGERQCARVLSVNVGLSTWVDDATRRRCTQVLLTRQ